MTFQWHNKIVTPYIALQLCVWCRHYFIYPVSKSACTDAISGWSLCSSFSSSWLSSVWVWKTCSIFNLRKNKLEAEPWCGIIVTSQDTDWVANAFHFGIKSMWIMQDKPFSWVDVLKEIFNKLLKKLYDLQIILSHLSIALNNVIRDIHLEFSWFLQYRLSHLHKMNRINCYESKNIRLPGYISVDANENGFVPTSLK